MDRLDTLLRPVSILGLLTAGRLVKDYNHTDMTVYVLYGPATGNSLLETASSPRGVIIIFSCPSCDVCPFGCQVILTIHEYHSLWFAYYRLIHLILRNPLPGDSSVEMVFTSMITTIHMNQHLTLCFFTSPDQYFLAD